MIGEHSVRIKELTALNIRTEGCKHIGCVKSADSVSCVNNDLEACKRLVVFLGVDALFYHFTQMRAVDFHIIRINAKRHHGFIFPAVNLFRIGEKHGDILALKSAVGSEKFQSVSLPRMMTCRDLNSSVTFEVES